MDRAVHGMLSRAMSEYVTGLVTTVAVDKPVLIIVGIFPIIFNELLRARHYYLTTRAPAIRF